MQQLIETRPIEHKKYRLPYECELCSKEATTEVYLERDNCIHLRRCCDQCLSSPELWAALFKSEKSGCSTTMRIDYIV